MNTIIEMARKADLKTSLSEPYRIDPETGAWLERFAALVRADEREACARIADSMDPLQDGAIAFVIRTRGNT